VELSIIDVDTSRPATSMAYVNALEHSVLVDDGSDEWVTVKVRSSYEDGMVLLAVESDRPELCAALGTNTELQADCLREWQERFEMEACDGIN
jgi:hypothetical protein